MYIFKKIFFIAFLVLFFVGLSGCINPVGEASRGSKYVSNVQGEKTLGGSVLFIGDVGGNVQPCDPSDRTCQAMLPRLYNMNLILIGHYVEPNDYRALLNGKDPETIFKSRYYNFVFDSDDDQNGHNGKDMLFGGQGNDNQNGGAGPDVLYGNEGNDWMYGDSGVDRLYGGEGNDNMNGGEDSDTLYGGSGNDIMYDGDYTSSGNDTLFGENGDDAIFLSKGKDTVYAGTGNDRISIRNPDANSDKLIYAEDGNDSITYNIYSQSSGIDRILGGNGFDTVDFPGSNPPNSYVSYDRNGTDRYGYYDQYFLSGRFVKLYDIEEIR